MNTQEYVYLRTKNVFLNDEGELELFVFAGLSINTVSEEKDSRKKTVKNVASRVLEYEIKKAPAPLVELENGDLRRVIDEEIFNHLQQQADSDPVLFCTFSPDIR